MKLRRSLALLLVFTLLFASPCTALAQLNVKQLISWCMYTMEACAENYGFSAEWMCDEEFKDDFGNDVAFYTLHLVERANFKIIQHSVFFSIDEMGNAVVAIVSDYNDNLANDLRYHNQMSFLLNYLLTSAAYADKQQLEAVATVSNDAMNCISDILSGDKEQHYDYNNSDLKLSVFDYEYEASQAIAIIVTYSTDKHFVSMLPNNSVVPSAAPSVTPRPVYNNQIIIRPGYKLTCPFTVNAPKDSNCYVYLEYMSKSHNSVEDREPELYSDTGYVESDFAMFVKAGETASTDVPIGVYKLYYATGEDFYDTDILFGEDTSYFTTDDIFNFYADGEYYNGHTITLYSVLNGNMTSDEIDESQFPKR